MCPRQRTVSLGGWAQLPQNGNIGARDAHKNDGGRVLERLFQIAFDRFAPSLQMHVQRCQRPHWGRVSRRAAVDLSELRRRLGDEAIHCNVACRVASHEE